MVMIKIKMCKVSSSIPDNVIIVGKNLHYSNITKRACSKVDLSTFETALTLFG